MQNVSETGYEKNTQFIYLKKWFRSPSIVSISLYILCCVTCFVVVEKYNIITKSFLWTGIVINALGATVFYKLMSSEENNTDKDWNWFRRFVFILVAVCTLLISFESFYLAYWSGVDGFSFNIGLVLINIIIVVSFFIASRKVLNKNIIFCGTYLLIAFVIQSFYVSNQLHMLHEDKKILVTMMIKGWIYVVESTLFFFWLNRKRMYSK